MFQLTKREKQLIAFVLAVFLLGWGVQQFVVAQEFRKAELERIENEFAE